MTRKIALFFVLVFSISFCCTSFAQKGADDVSYKNLKFSAQPKHMWEVGIHGGHFMVIGDILPKPGWGVGLHIRRALDYAWALRLDVMHGQACGLEPRNSGASFTSHGEANYVLKENYGGTAGNQWYHNYKLKYYQASLQGVWSLNSFNFKRQIRRANWYVLAGPGINFYETYYDAKSSDDRWHDFQAVDDGLEPGVSREDRKTVLDRLDAILDGDYETRAETAKGRRSGNQNEDNNERQYNATATVGAGLSFRLNRRFNIGLEHQVMLTFGNEGDLLDGYRWRTTQDLTQFKDLINYTHLRLNFNIGNKDKASEPLWWVSPLDLLAEDLAEVKARPELDLTDSDSDGIIDMLDQEKDTEKDCPTDTRGVILDSDGDGVVDCRDKEPHSPPGYKVDGEGIANVPVPEYVNEDDVNKIVDAKIAGIKFPTVAPAPRADWFLPMVHFDLDKYSIKDTEYGKLHHVATVMKQNPSVRVVAGGYTDQTAGNCYNDLLSYNRAQGAVDYLVSKYGIARDRFIVNWGGENNNLVPTTGRSLINRRVEFKVAEGETNMGRPDCGVGSAGSGGGTKYSGNKEAGY